MVLYELIGSSGGWAGFEWQVFLSHSNLATLSADKTLHFRESRQNLIGRPGFFWNLGLFMACLCRLHRISTNLLLFWPTSCFVWPGQSASLFTYDSLIFVAPPPFPPPVFSSQFKDSPLDKFADLLPLPLVCLYFFFPLFFLPTKKSGRATSARSPRKNCQSFHTPKSAKAR